MRMFPGPFLPLIDPARYLRVVVLITAVLTTVGAWATWGTAAVEAQTADLRRQVERILAGEGESKGEAACAVLSSGVLEEALAVESEWSYRPGSKYVPQALCTATAASGHEASLTLLVQSFDSPSAAVAALESTVEQLSEGVTVEVAGRERTTQVDFEGWIDGVGDRAAWAPRLSELQVAHDGIRFAVGVRGFASPDENKARAIELARRIAAAL